MAYHLGAATFSEVLGEQRCDELALRNTLLFIWKNIRHPWHLTRHVLGLAVRLSLEPLRALRSPASRRWMLCKALAAAIRRRRQMPSSPHRELTLDRLDREWSYFRCFHPASIDRRRDFGEELANAPRTDLVLQMAEVQS
jgi:hypothetical protein